MKAAVLEGPGAGLVVRDIDIAEPIGREVLVDIKASGLCHSDLHMIENPAGFPAAAVLGHEASGVVVAVGPDVTEFEVGDHVVGCLVSHCGRCERCTTGRPYQCRNAAETMRQPGEGARLSVEGAPAIQFWNLGAFAAQMLVHENNIVKVDPSIPFEKAALLGCGVVTGAGAVINTAKTRVGDTVAVIGCGGVGLSAIQGAALAGARRIIAVDLVPAKLELAKRFGATDVVNPADGDVIEQVKELTGGRGVDKSFEVIGLPQTSAQAIRMLDTGGSAYLIGLHKPGSVLEIDVMRDLLVAQRSVQGVYMGSTNFKQDIPMFADYYLQGRLNLDDLLSQTIPIERINEGYAELKEGGVARSVGVF